MAISKMYKICIVEVGILAGIVLSAFTVPRSTRLDVFLIASFAIFLVANIILFRSFRQSNSSLSPDRTKFNRHLRNTALILSVPLVLYLLMHLAK